MNIASFGRDLRHSLCALVIMLGVALGLQYVWRAVAPKTVGRRLRDVAFALVSALTVGSISAPAFASGPIPGAIPQSISSELKLKALRILAKAAAYQPTQVMTTAPTFTGPAFGVASGTVVAGGSGYVYLDIINVVGGTLATNGQAAQFQVTVVSGGIVTGIKELNPGQYTTAPTGTVATTDATTGAATGLTIAVTGNGSLVHPGRTLGSGGQDAVVGVSPYLQQISGLWGTDPLNSNLGQTGMYISRTTGSASFGGTAHGNTNGYGLRYVTDSQTMDFTLTALSTGGQFAVYMTDLATGVRKKTQAADYAVSQTLSGYKLDFGSRASRVIEVYFGIGIYVRGISVEPTSNIWSGPLPDDIKMATMGDSYSEGYDAVNRTRGGLMYELGARLGAPNPIVNAQYGTGCLNNGGAGNTFLFRATSVANGGGGNLDASLIGNMDIVFLWPTLSINDPNASGYTTTAAQACVTSYVQAVMAAQPNAFIITVGLQSPSGQTQANYAAVQAGVAAAAATDPTGRVLYIDNSGVTGDRQQTGSGNAGSLKGDGNGDFYLDSLGVHPNDAGHSFLGRRNAEATIRLLRVWLGEPVSANMAQPFAPKDLTFANDNMIEMKAAA